METLQIADIRAGYGAEDVLRSLSLTAVRGQVSFVVGPNGAGKTTLARALSGLIPLESGTINMNGNALNRMSTSKRARVGLALIPEGRQIFPRLSVHEQLYVATRIAPRRERQARLEFVYELLPRLKDLRDRDGGVLSGGEQQLLAIGRAIALRPSYVILDEPTMGLSPSATKVVGDAIGSLCQNDIGVVVLAQDLHLSTALSGETHVLVGGEWRMHWVAGEVPDNEEFVNAYFGHQQ